MGDEDTPEGWHWGIGNRSSSYYTHWLYSDETFDVGRRAPDRAVEWGYEIQQYWDEGNDHTVIASKSYYDADGDVIQTSHEETAKAESEEDATEEALRIARSLSLPQ